MARTRLPAIPRARFGSADQQRQSDAMQTLAETLSGRRGSGLDRAVLVRDLADAGLVNLKSIGGNVSIGGGKPPIWDDTPGSSGEFNFPPEPLNLQVFGAFTAIALTWDNADYVRASTAAHTEIWRNDVDSLATAYKLATTISLIHSDPVGTGSNYFYWIRHVNVNDDGVSKKGPYSSSVNGTTSNDISNIIEDLAEQMVSSELIAALLSDIDTTIADGDKLVSEALSEAEIELKKADEEVIKALSEAEIELKKADAEVIKALSEAEIELNRADELLFDVVAKVSDEYKDADRDLAASIKEVSIATADADLVLAQTVKQLNAAYNSVSVSEVASTNAKITETQKVAATATEAVALRASALEATVNGTEDNPSLMAQVIELDKANATATEAVALRTTSLEATVNGTDDNPGIMAQVVELDKANATATEAVALRTDKLEATVNGTDDNPGIMAQVIELDKANATATEAVALRTTSLEATVNGTDDNPGIMAQVIELDKANATATEAVALRATSLEATVNGTEDSPGIMAQVVELDKANATATEAVAITVAGQTAIWQEDDKAVFDAANIGIQDVLDQASGSNLIKHPWFNASKVQGGWDHGAGDVVAITELDGVTHALTWDYRDLYNVPNTIHVVGGERLYIGCWLYSRQSKARLTFGVNTRIDGAHQGQWITGAYLEAGLGWHWCQGSILIPGTVTSITPWLQIAVPHSDRESRGYVTGLVISRQPIDIDPAGTAEEKANAALETAQADIKAASKVAATATEAVALRTDKLEVTVNGTEDNPSLMAQVIELDKVNATATEAVALRATSLEATVNGTEDSPGIMAQVVELDKANATATEAVAITVAGQTAIWREDDKEAAIITQAAAALDATGKANAAETKAIQVSVEEATRLGGIAVQNVLDQASGSNLIKHPWFGDSLSQGGWDHGAGDVVAISGLDGLTHALTWDYRDLYNVPNTIHVTGGETLYFGCWFYAGASKAMLTFGVNTRINRVHQPQWLRGATLNAGLGWHWCQGSIVIPSAVTSITPWLQIDVPHSDRESRGYVTGLVISRLPIDIDPAGTAEEKANAAEAAAALDATKKANAAEAAAEAYALARQKANLLIDYEHSTNVEQDGVSFRQSTGSGTWTGWFSSVQKFTGGCGLRFQAGTVNASAMCGINSPDKGTGGYTDIDHCFYLEKGGQYYIYENGGKRAGPFPFSKGTAFSIRYDGENVIYRVDGKEIRTVATLEDKTFVADGSLRLVSSEYPVKSVTFADSEGAATLAKKAQAAAEAAAALDATGKADQALKDARADISTVAETAAKDTSAAVTRVETIETEIYGKEGVGGLKAQLKTTEELLSSVNEDGSVAHKALWSKVATAGEITAGIGLLAKSDGTSEVAVSASKFTVFDPANPEILTPLFSVSEGNVVIPKAFIEEATIQILDAEVITADKIVASASITTPAISGGTLDIGRFHVEADGKFWAGTSEAAAGLKYTASTNSLKVRGDIQATSLQADTLMIRKKHVYSNEFSRLSDYTVQKSKISGYIYVDAYSKTLFMMRFLNNTSWRTMFWLQIKEHVGGRVLFQGKEGEAERGEHNRTQAITYRHATNKTGGFWIRYTAWMSGMKGSHEHMDWAKENYTTVATVTMHR